MRQRAGALYIQNNRLLLISEGGQDFFWTPGGGLEENEDFLEALERELYEELTATLKTAHSFTKFYDPDADEEVKYFLVDIDLPKKLPSSTKIHWYSKADFDINRIKISRRIYHIVFPQLIDRAIIKTETA